jgi:hypothetical protein
MVKKAATDQKKNKKSMAKDSVKLIETFLADGDSQSARVHYESMSKLGRSPSTDNQKAKAAFKLINWYVDNGQIENAQPLFQALARRSDNSEILFLQVEAIGKMVGILEAQGKFAEAKGLRTSIWDSPLGEKPMERAKIIMDTIRELIKKNRTEEALYIYKSLMIDKLSPDFDDAITSLWEQVLELLNDCRKYKDCYSFFILINFDEIAPAFLVDFAPQIQHLIFGLAFHGELDKALEAFAFFKNPELPKSTWRLHLSTALALMEIMADNNLILEALDLWFDLPLNKNPLEHQTQVSILKGLIKMVRFGQYLNHPDLLQKIYLDLSEKFVDTLDYRTYDYVKNSQILLWVCHSAALCYAKSSDNDTSLLEWAVNEVINFGQNWDDTNLTEDHLNTLWTTKMTLAKLMLWPAQQTKLPQAKALEDILNDHEDYFTILGQAEGVCLLMDILDPENTDILSFFEPVYKLREIITEKDSQYDPIWESSLDQDIDIDELILKGAGCMTSAILHLLKLGLTDEAIEFYNSLPWACCRDDLCVPSLFQATYAIETADPVKTETDTDNVTDTYIDTGTDTDTVTDADTEAETDTVTGTVTVTDTDTGTQTDTQTDTETENRVSEEEGLELYCHILELLKNTLYYDDAARLETDLLDIDLEHLDTSLALSQALSLANHAEIVATEWLMQLDVQTALRVANIISKLGKHQDISFHYFSAIGRITDNMSYSDHIFESLQSLYFVNTFILPGTSEIPSSAFGILHLFRITKALLKFYPINYNTRTNIDRYILSVMESPKIKQYKSLQIFLVQIITEILDLVSQGVLEGPGKNITSFYNYLVTVDVEDKYYLPIEKKFLYDFKNDSHVSYLKFMLLNGQLEDTIELFNRLNPMLTLLEPKNVKIPDFFTIMIGKLASANRLQDAVAWYKKFDLLPNDPNTVSRQVTAAHRLITALINKADLAQARLIAFKLASEDNHISWLGRVMALKLLVEGYCRYGFFDEALAVYWEILKAPFSNTLYRLKSETLLSLVEALTKVGETTAAAHIFTNREKVTANDFQDPNQEMEEIERLLSSNWSRDIVEIKIKASFGSFYDQINLLNTNLGEKALDLIKECLLADEEDQAWAVFGSLDFLDNNEIFLNQASKLIAEYLFVNTRVEEAYNLVQSRTDQLSGLDAARYETGMKKHLAGLMTKKPRQTLAQS